MKATAWILALLALAAVAADAAPNPGFRVHADEIDFEEVPGSTNLLAVLRNVTLAIPEDLPCQPVDGGIVPSCLTEPGLAATTIFGHEGDLVFALLIRAVEASSLDNTTIEIEFERPGNWTGNLEDLRFDMPKHIADQEFAEHAVTLQIVLLGVPETQAAADGTYDVRVWANAGGNFEGGQCTDKGTWFSCSGWGCPSIMGQIGYSCGATCQIWANELRCCDAWNTCLREGGVCYHAGEDWAGGWFGMQVGSRGGWVIHCDAPKGKSNGRGGR